MMIGRDKKFPFYWAFSVLDQESYNKPGAQYEALLFAQKVLIETFI